MSKVFKLGQTVKWSSSAGGHVREKQGEVVAVFRPGIYPTAHRLERDYPDCSAGSTLGGGYGRDHESYLIKVPGPTPKSKPRLYWPRVSALELVAEA